MSTSQIYNKYENTKQRISDLVFQIEKEYKEMSLVNHERERETEEREHEIERVKQRLQYIQSENEELQQSANESFLRNSFLQSQIEETELEQQQNMQVIQQMNRKINYLQDIKKNLENMNNIHSNSIENACIMEQANDEYKKQMEQNNIKIQKIDTEIQFSKERLEALLKKYQTLKMNEKSIKELQMCIDKEKSKYNKQMQNLSLQNSTLQSQLKDMKTQMTQKKQEAKANKEPRQQYTMAQIAQILTPEDFDRKPKYQQEHSETSCKTFHLFQESSFMNKIRVSDFNQNNYPDNQSDRVSFISIRQTHSQSNPNESSQLPYLQLAAPTHSLQFQKNKPSNQVIYENEDAYRQSMAQSNGNPQILNKLNQKTQQQSQQSLSNQFSSQSLQNKVQPEKRQQNGQQQQTQQLSQTTKSTSNNSKNLPPKQNLSKSNTPQTQMQQQQPKQPQQKIYESQYISQQQQQQNQIAQQQLQQYEQFLQQQKQQQQQQQLQDESFYSSFLGKQQPAQNQQSQQQKIPSSQSLSKQGQSAQQQIQVQQQQKQTTPSKQQIISTINKNIQRNRAITNYQDLSSSSNSSQNLNDNNKKQAAQAIFESQVIFDQPKQKAEATPTKSKANQLAPVNELPVGRARIAASVQVSSSDSNTNQMQNNLINSANKSILIGNHQRKKSNSIYQSLIIGAGVVAAGFFCYKLAPKR